MLKWFPINVNLKISIRYSFEYLRIRSSIKSFYQLISYYLYGIDNLQDIKIFFLNIDYNYFYEVIVDEKILLKRITINPKIFGGKPIIRGRRLAVEHILGMLAAGDTTDTILEGYPWLELEDIQACLAYAHRIVGHERIELFTIAEQAA